MHYPIRVSELLQCGLSVLDEAEQGEHILYVRGVQELEAAEFHKGNAAPGELHLKRSCGA
jgi:hypothetical protein